MSAELLQRAKAHIVDTGGLLASYTIRFYRWNDRDLQGKGSVALFRMAGTAATVAGNHEAQQNDISLFLLADRALVKKADDDMLAVLRYLRSNYASAGVHAFHPLGVTGPSYLENGRGLFEMLIRAGTADH